MRAPYRASLLLAALFIAGPVVGAERLAGTALVVDGDTIEVGEQRVRLLGVDAPEGAQMCNLDARPWQCGDDAEAALRAMADRRQAQCDVLGRDRWGRALAVCWVDGVDLARAMVRQGWALAWYPVRGSVPGPDYSKEQEEAKEAGRGLWAGQFAMPWAWRRGQ